MKKITIFLSIFLLLAIFVAAVIPAPELYAGDMQSVPEAAVLNAGKKHLSETEMADLKMLLYWGMTDDYDYRSPGVEVIKTRTYSYGKDADKIYPGEVGGRYEGTDPLGRFYIPFRYQVSKINWILKYIYHLTEAQTSQLWSSMLSDNKMYIQDGYLYLEGDDYERLLDAIIIELQFDGTYYYATYSAFQYNFDNRYRDWTRYAVLDYETIDGVNYWTLYYSGKEKGDLWNDEAELISFYDEATETDVMLFDEYGNPITQQESILSEADAAEAEWENTENAAWAEAYRAQLMSDEYHIRMCDNWFGYGNILFFDITGDGIPEMFYVTTDADSPDRGPGYGTWEKVFAWTDGMLLDITPSIVYPQNDWYILSDQYLFYLCGAAGSLNATMFTANGSGHLYVSFSCGDESFRTVYAEYAFNGTNLQIVDFFYEYEDYYSNSYYVWNDTFITEETFRNLEQNLLSGIDRYLLRYDLDGTGMPDEMRYDEAINWLQQQPAAVPEPTTEDPWAL